MDLETEWDLIAQKFLKWFILTDSFFAIMILIDFSVLILLSHKQGLVPDVQ